jgi:CRP/FNR family transcriptional regulator, dissimilatory nitrate respiration regulator
MKGQFMKRNYDLREILLFSGLSDSEIQSIKKFSSVRNYSKGEIIFFDTEPYTGIYGILDGIVKIYKMSDEGREHIMHLEYPGNTFGDVPMFENISESDSSEMTYPANSMALDNDTVVVKVPVKPFTEFIKSNNEVSLKMLSAFAKRLRFLNNHIGSITLGDVSKRLSRYLLSEYEKSTGHNGKNPSKQDSVDLRISKYDLASHLGTITETLSRVFKKLQNENIIEVKGKTIIINDISLLRMSAK